MVKKIAIERKGKNLSEKEVDRIRELKS